MDSEQNADQQAFITQLYARARKTAAELGVDVQAVQDAVDAIPSPVTDHGLLSGLGDNDHPQYLLVADSGDLASLDSVGADKIDGAARIKVVPWHATSTNDFLLTNSPIAARIVGGLRYRHVRNFDLTGYTQVRMLATVSVASNSLNTPKLALHFKTGANSALAVDYAAAGTSAVSISLAAVGHVSSGWVNLDDAAKTDVLLTLIESGGNGSADPVLGWLHLEFK